MRCLKRNKRTIFVSEKYQDNLITKFKKPIEIPINYQYTNTEADLIALGLEFPMYIRIKCDEKDVYMFTAKNRVYVGIKPSDPFDPLCKDANYEVDGEPKSSLNSFEVTLKKLSGK